MNMSKQLFVSTLSPLVDYVADADRHCERIDDYLERLGEDRYDPDGPRCDLSVVESAVGDIITDFVSVVYNCLTDLFHISPVMEYLIRAHVSLIRYDDPLESFDREDEDAFKLNYPHVYKLVRDAEYAEDFYDIVEDIEDEAL